MLTVTDLGSQPRDFVRVCGFHQLALVMGAQGPGLFGFVGRSGAHVGSLLGAGGAERTGDRVVSVTWRKPSGEVTVDGESG